MSHVTEITSLAVDLIGVEKFYGRAIHALRGVNVQVRKGEVFGLLGPNGAGKSTLVKIMMTVVKPDKVTGTILGRPIGHLKKKAVIGYLPEVTRFPRYLTARQVLDYYGKLAHVSVVDRKRTIPDLLERVGLSHRWHDQKCSKFSKGMLRRLGLAQALVNDPELVVLDEPTDGLDPIGRRDVRELLTELRSNGKTIFLNSHLLSEIEMVCDRVAILNQGLVARQGTLSELTEHTVEYHIKASGELSSIAADVEKIGGTVRDGMVVLADQDMGKVNTVIDLLRGRGMMIESVVPHRFSLEDVFVQILGSDAKGLKTVDPGQTPPVAARPVQG